MNCATHNTVEAVAYCRTCGKALCATCSRPVHGVIYCENCLAARLEGVQPPAAATPAAGFVAPAVGGGPVPPTPGPNPTVAGILGAIPLGFGAIYNGQYAKGLAHLVIFFFLVWGADHVSGLLGLAIPFFVVYQIFDAVRSAKAIQSGQPAPDPFGLAQTFSTGQKTDMTKVPTGALVLIGLGVLFMLHTLGVFEFGVERVWPFLLILLGGWLFARRWGLLGGASGCQCPRCRARCLIGPAVLVTIGVLGMLATFQGLGWERTWPVILLVIGVMKLVSSNASSEGHRGTDPGSLPPTGLAPGSAEPPSSEVHHV